MNSYEPLINIISEEDIFRLLKRTKHTSKIARKAVQNIIIPFPNFVATEFNNEIWTVLKKEKYGHSYNLYIHSLRVCEELMLEYEHTNNIIYFNKTAEIINSWMNYEESGKETEMMWYDHAAANRTQVLIHFIYLSQKLNKNMEHQNIYDLLIKHGKVYTTMKSII